MARGALDEQEDVVVSNFSSVLAIFSIIRVQFFNHLVEQIFSIFVGQRGRGLVWGWLQLKLTPKINSWQEILKISCLLGVFHQHSMTAVFVLFYFFIIFLLSF